MAARSRTLRGLMLYFGKLGTWGFGGPIALCGYMHRDLVEERHWYTEEEYQQGLAIAQTMPGPLAAQLAMWLGYLERGTLGALAITLPFVVPPFLIVLAVAIAYAHYQGIDAVESLFFGIGPTVIAFTDAVAMGLISPGPVVIMATFAGYLVYGVAGATVATIAVFVPVFLFVVVPGRFFRRYEKHRRLMGFVKGATAAAAGAIAGAAIVIGRQTIGGWLSTLIFAAALVLLLQRRIRVPEPAVVALGTLAGLALHE